jgi:hypothetical protein
VSDYKPSAIDRVKELQLSERYMMGAVEGRESLQEPPSYFLVDSRTRSRTNFANELALYDAAAAAGVRLALEPVDSFYWRYRWSSFDLFALILLVIPPMFAGATLIRRIVQLRRPQYTEAS